MRARAAIAASALALALVGCGESERRASMPTTATTETTPTATTQTTAPSPRTTPATTPTLPPATAGPPKPHIVQSPIPFPAARHAEMRAYAQRHYGLDTDKLVDPKVIVEHFTGSEDFESAFNTFAPDTADSELHELPGLCSQFIVDRDGTIHQLVPLDQMCRHTVGLNWTAIGIENVGVSDAEILGNAKQLSASLALTRWLQDRFGIRTRNVIGHNESLSSRYHHERVAALRTQTHDDWNRADMDIYRKKLEAR